jgi:hypothetical protein
MAILYAFARQVQCGDNFSRRTKLWAFEINTGVHDQYGTALAGPSTAPGMVGTNKQIAIVFCLWQK